MAFTEQGVAMLSSVLNNKRAIDVNIAIIGAFSKLRSMLEGYKELQKKSDAIVSRYDEQFRVVLEAIKQLIKKDEKPQRKIGF